MNPVANPQSAIQDQQFFYGVLAQLVERLNGIDALRNTLIFAHMF
jgi:hypothetical protein